MKLYKFTLPDVKIKSSWFDDGENIYKKMGKEEGLNLYIQLFRFRVHQGNYNEHMFRTSLLELRQFTNINKTKRLTISKLKDMLLNLESVGVIKLHSSGIRDMIGNEMLVIEATDVPEVSRVGGKDVISNEEFYIPVKLDLIDYIYNVLNYTSKEVALFVLFSMYGMRKGESKTNMRINSIRSRLGTRNETITDIIIKFNESGILYTVAKGNGKRVKFEHYLCKSVKDINKFTKETKAYREKFLKRYKNKNK